GIGPPTAADRAVELVTIAAGVATPETPGVTLAATPGPAAPAVAEAGGLTAVLPETVEGGDTAATAVPPLSTTPAEVCVAPPITGPVVETVLSPAGSEVGVVEIGGSSLRPQPARSAADIRTRPAVRQSMGGLLI